MGSRRSLCWSGAVLDDNARMSKTSTFGHSVLQGDSRFVLTQDDRRWPVAAAGLVWLVAGLTGGYWVLQALGRTEPVPVSTAAASLPVIDSISVARVLGQPDAEAGQDGMGMAQTVALRYNLLGVVADRRQQGAALIAIDGEPARPYAVGAELEGGLVLQSVDRRVARLGPTLEGPSTVELAVPEESAISPTSRAPSEVYTPPSIPDYTPPPIPAYIPPSTPPGASPDLVPGLPGDRGGDGTTVLPGGSPPGS